jgi:hypothetical protein
LYVEEVLKVSSSLAVASFVLVITLNAIINGARIARCSDYATGTKVAELRFEGEETV